MMRRYQIPVHSSQQPNQTSATALKRRGFTVAEMIATFVVLSAAIVLAAPLLTSVSRQRLAIQQRQFAIQHAGNMLERYSARTWGDLTPGLQTLPDAPADLHGLLPELKQSLEVKENSEKPIARQLTMTVSWRGTSGTVVKPVQLSEWIFQPEEQ